MKLHELDAISCAIAKVYKYRRVNALTNWRSAAPARVAVALLAVAILAGCGGGGGSSSSGGGQVRATISASTLTFANQVILSTSAAQTVTASSTGLIDLSFSSVSITGANAGDFTKTSDACSGAAVLPNSTCAVSIKFTPYGAGNRTATLVFSDNATGSPQMVSLKGFGTGPSASLSFATLAFPDQFLGTTSTGIMETATNSGNQNLTISAVPLTGLNASDFSRTADTCTGANLAPGATCMVSLTFTPLALGGRVASLNFMDNAFNTPQIVPVSGNGVQAAASLSTTTMSFGNLLVNTTTASQTVIVLNTGSGNLILTAVTVGGVNPSQFTKTADSCAGSTVNPNNSCSATVTFNPTVVGSASATLTFSDNAPNTPQVVNLSGTGVQPITNFSSPGLSFGSLALNTTSTAMTETVTNSGTTNLDITSVNVTGTNPGDFSKSSDNCTNSPVAPNASCAVNVKFTPTALGARSAKLQFTDDAAASPQPVNLAGTGVQAPQLSPTSVTFAGENIGTTGPAQTVTLTNFASMAFNITAFNHSGAFSITNNCPVNLAANASCQILVASSPTASGTFYGSLSVSTDVTNTAQTVNLIGTGNGPLTAVLTQRYDNARTGQNTQEVSLTPSNVAVREFGKLFALPVDGQVYAQPLYLQGVTIPGQGVHNVLFVATEHDSVYAFDADGQSLTPLWHDSFINPANGVTTVPNQDVMSTDLKPEIGITSTPVIDPVTGTLYLTAKTKEAVDPSCTSSCTYNYFHRLHALDITTGAEKFGGPVAITASVNGTGYDNVSGVVSLKPLTQLQRAGLMLLNGIVYLGFGSHGDVPAYHGWLLAYDASTLQQVAVFNVTPNSSAGAIWQSGGGISADAAGDIYVVTSNGIFDVDRSGIDYGDSVLRLQLQSGQFQVLDYFTPYNQSVLEANDLDLGASPALIVPDQSGPLPHILITGGKDGRVWILNRDNLGHIQTNDAGAVQVIPNGSDHLFGGGSYWNGTLYIQEVGDFLYAYPLLNGTAQTPTVSTFQIGYPNAPPVISANGTNNGIVWMVKATSASTGAAAVLYAFDATDVTNELYDSSQLGSDQAGPGVKFAVPTIINGKVYVGAASEVDVYGLLP